MTSAAHLLAGHLLAGWVVLAGGTPALAGNDEAERARLRKSWSETCERFSSEKDWSALEACNLAWFHAHEKAVWQLNLNPHGAAAVLPSS